MLKTYVMVATVEVGVQIEVLIFFAGISIFREWDTSPGSMANMFKDGAWSIRGSSIF